MTEKPTSAPAEVVFGIATVATAGVMFLQTQQWQTSARVFPLIVCLAVALLGVVMSVRAVSKLRLGNTAPFLDTPAATLKAFAGLGGYLAGIVVLGLLPATAVAIPAIAAMFGYRNWRRSIPGGLIVAVLIWALFVLAFDRRLPLGLIGQIIWG